MKSLRLHGELCSLEIPKVMGIVNYTEDSFYSGSRYRDEAAVLKAVEEMLAAGADWIDVGVVSSRPGAESISEKDEIQRLMQFLPSVVKHFPDACVSVDTWRASVAQCAVETGAAMINDISGGTFDPKMLDTMVELNVPYILMHTTGTPAEMQSQTQYSNLLTEIYRFFAQKIHYLTERGFSDILLDVGFGFGKTLEQNYFLLKNLAYFQSLNFPLLAGISRKSMVYKFLDISPEAALNGTSVLHYACLQAGASVLRVHDVKAAKEVVRLYQRLHQD